MNNSVDCGSTRVHVFRGVSRDSADAEPDLEKLRSDLMDALGWLDYKRGQHTKANALYLACLALADLIGQPEGGVPFEALAGPFAFAVLEVCDGHLMALGDRAQAARYVGVKVLLSGLAADGDDIGTARETIGGIEF
jgi:hypothetical protein